MEIYSVNLLFFAQSINVIVFQSNSDDVTELELFSCWNQSLIYVRKKTGGLKTYKTAFLPRARLLVSNQFLNS